LEDQLFICNFTEKSCIEERHDECAEEYEGMGIKALCICTCHDEKKKQLPSRESNLAAGDDGRLQLDLFDSKVGIANVTKTNST
jgi:hypothetical protein